jgi:hypothetical protein
MDEFTQRLEAITECRIYGYMLTPTTVVFDFGETVSPSWLRAFGLGKVNRKLNRTYLVVAKEE